MNAPRDWKKAGELKGRTVYETPEGDLMIWDSATRGWREVASCELNDDED